MDPIETQSQAASLAVGSPAQAPAAGAQPKSLHWVVAFIAATIMVVSGHLLIKAGLSAVTTDPSASLAVRMAGYLFEPMILEGLAIYSLATLFWMVAVAQKDLSYLYPLTSVNYVLIVLASALLFQESISMQRGAGVVLITLGAALLNRRTTGGKHES